MNHEDQYQEKKADVVLPKGVLHFMGVCGVGMAGVAYLLSRKGWKVTGCDAQLNAWAGPLRAAGVSVSEGHDPAHIEQVSGLIITPAVHPDHPELLAAKARGIPIFRRGEVLAQLVSETRSVAVCGTHGKTTTSCFVTHLLRAFEAKPSWCIGGATESMGFVAGAPENSPLLVVEADESDGTLARYHASILVVNNLDVDHLEHFDGVDDLHNCFRQAIVQAREGVVVCRDHPVAYQVARSAKVPLLTFGFSPEADLRASSPKYSAAGSSCQVSYQGETCTLSLPLAGTHNLLNVLGAIGALIRLGYPFRKIIEMVPHACTELPGRRFETVFQDPSRNLRVVTDYAHHPIELQKAVEMAKLCSPKRLRVVFQPHRYTRTLALRDQFPPAFAAADEVILLPVYAASEDPISGGGIGDLYGAFRSSGTTKVLLARSVEEVAYHLRVTIRPGDFILIAGAGSVVRLARSAADWAVPLPSIQPVETASLSFYRVGGLCTGGIQICKGGRAFDWDPSKDRVVGAGANSWFSDLATPERIIRMLPDSASDFKRISETEVEISAGMCGAALLDQLEKLGLGGLACMDSIPGSVGGWLAMNAGAHGGTIGNHVKTIRCLNSDGKVAIISHEKCGFGYRCCDALRNAIALSCILCLEPSSPETIHAERLAIRARRIPLGGLRSCGSLFRNPEGDSAGRLLDQAGCKGLRVGGAFVTDFHANIVATDSHATASDVLALALQMRNRVWLQTGIRLEPEVRGLDFQESV